MTQTATRGWIAVTALAGFWGGLGGSALLLPVRSSFVLFLPSTAWSGFAVEHILGAGAAIGLALGTAVGIGLAVSALPLARIITAIGAGVGALLLTVTTLPFWLLRVTPPGPWALDTLRATLLLGPVAAGGLMLAAHLWLRDGRIPWGIAWHLLFGGVTAFVCTLVLTRRPTPPLAFAAGGGAVLGLAQLAALALLARLPRPVRRARLMAVALAAVTLACAVFLQQSVPRRRHLYEGTPPGRALFAFARYLERHRDAIEKPAPLVTPDLALRRLLERRPELAATEPIAARDLDDLLAIYVTLRADRDPEWAVYRGCFEPAGSVTRHRDADAAARLALDVALIRALERLSDQDARWIERALAVSFLAEAEGDYRVEAPAYALYPATTVFTIFSRDDMPLETRRERADATLREFPLVLDDFRGKIRRLPPLTARSAMRSCDDVLAYFRELAVDGAPPLRSLAVAHDAVAGYRSFLEGAIDPAARPRVGMGPERYHAMLVSEGEERSFADLTTLAWDKAMNGLDRALSTGFTLALQAKTGELRREKYDVADPLERCLREAVAARARLDLDGGAFPRPPGDTLDVAWAPAHFRGHRVAAYYWAHGDLAGPSKGVILLNSQEQDVYGARLLQWHEGWPGHHLQHAMARAHAPLSRRLFPSKFYVEGWASYVEEAAREAWRPEPDALFDAAIAYSRADEAVNALQDLVLHVLSPPRDDAVKLLREAYGIPEDEAEVYLADVLRGDGYAGSYFFGRDAIERARKELGWPAARFHAEVLKLGPVPPSRIVGLLRRD